MHAHTWVWDWHREHSAPAQCPAWKIGQWSSFGGTSVKAIVHYYMKTRACIDNPAHHALHEFDQTTRDLRAPRPNGRGGMTRPLAPPIGLKVEAAMASAEINAELVCPLRRTLRNFPPRTTFQGNTWLWCQETQPHWRGEQMYDLQIRSPG